jgi:hypothetical protein
MVLCYASATSYLLARFEYQAITLSRQNAGGVVDLATATVFTPNAPTPIRAMVKDRWVRLWVGGVEVIRYRLEGGVPAGTSHGLRRAGFFTGYFDNLLITDTPVVPPTVTSVFAYRGRDTKLDDIAGGV